MAESLRDQQKRLARLRILEAAIADIADVGPAALAVAAVAEHAGVSLRTVYNYFPDKDALIDAIVVEVRERATRLGLVEAEPELEKFPDMIRTNSRVADALGMVGDAQTRIETERRRRPRRRPKPDPTTAALTAALTSTRGDLTEAQLDALTATLVRLVIVGPHHDRRRDADRDGTVSAWAFATLANAIEAGKGPFDDD